MSFWRIVFAVVWKDALAEMRTREIISAVLVFTLLVIVIFNFTFGISGESDNLLTSGMIWVTFVFSGVLSLNHSFVMEKEEGCIEGLLLAPVSREAVYIGKLLGNLLFMFVVEAIALTAFAFFFNLDVFTLQLIGIIVLTTIGFVTVGTVFSALAVNTRARELVLPVLFLPVVLPVIIGAVNASGLALSGVSWSGLSTWLQIIIAFDVILLTVSYLVFNYVIEE